MRKTKAQLHNEKMERLFEEAKALNKVHYPRHLFQMLTRLTEKVERANAIQHSGGIVAAEDWSELYALTNESKAVLERAKEANKDLA